MKRVVKLGMLLISLFFGINIVKADRSCDDIVMYAQSDFWGKTGINMNYAGINYNFSLYTLKDANGTAFSSYCRNAGVSAGKSYNGEKFKCKQVVFDTTTTNETRKTYDAGIVEILKQGYSTRNAHTTPLETNQEYTATNLALRTYEMLWPQVNTNGSNNTGNNNAHKYYVNMWLDDAEIQSLLKQSVGSVREKYSNATTVTSWTLVSTGGDVTSNIVNEAKRLVKEGLKAAANYKKNGAASLTWGDPVKSKSPTISNNGKSEYKVTLTYTFKAKKFMSNDAYINMSFSCPSCANYGVDYTLYVNDKNVGKTISGNLLEKDANGNDEIKVKIEFIADSDNYNYDEIPYVLTVKYYDETISTEAYDMYSSGCYSNTTCQHFYMLYADDVAQEAKIEDTVELATINCDDLKKQCEEENDPEACKKFNDVYGGTCVDCQAYVSNAVCSDTESEIDVKEGYVIDTSNCTVPSSPNVLSCIINNEDQSGNSYRATDLANNKYCSTWCKEDYHFTLPGNKEVESGRYFSLQASIKGTKTCYTSKIDKAAFETDFENARKSVIDAYNNWALYNAAVNAHGSNLASNPQSGAKHYGHYHSCSPCPTAAAGEPTPPCPSQAERCTWCSGNTAPNYTNYKYRFSFTAYDYDGTPLSTTSRLDIGDNTTCTISGGKVICTYESNGSSSCSHYSCSSTNGTDITSVYTSSDVTSKASVLNSVIGVETSAYYDNSTITPLAPKTSTVSNSSLNGILNNYNYCSRWEMDYTYDPDIYFWYEENYMNNVIKDKLDTVGSTTKSNVTIQRCTTDTNDSYESCSTGWTSANQYKTESKFLCSKKSDGTYECKFRNVSISQTIRMKESITAGGSYITPTQFYTIYPSGSIAVADSGTDIENATELTNKLPVGLGTTQGVYNYTLIVKNLGEYYNNDELGRIWGVKDSVVSTTLKENSKCQAQGALKYEVNINGETYFDNGVYVCAYKVNCPDCPVVCDPDCGNPDCPDNDCPVDCPDCIYTNNKTNVNYRPITSDDLNPNDRELGKNWQFDANNIKTGLELKAYATTKEIEESGETIYDIDFDTPTADTEFAMKVTMDSKMISKIREYNDRYEDSEGYLNNSLKCYDYKNSADGKTYKNIFCYSTFIDELLSDSNTKNNIEITVDRPLSEAERKNYNPANGYFTTWTLANSAGWKVTTQQGLSYYKTNYGTNVNIGPSWK